MSSPTLERNRVDDISDPALFRARLYERYRTDHVALDIADERRRRAPHLRELIRKHFPANRDATILDIGCGGGLLLFFLREAGYERLTGIEGAKEQAEGAKALGFSEVQCGDVFGILQATADQSFDVVVAFDIIEHLTKPELLHLADEIHRVLGVGGVWLIHAPNAEGVFGNRVRYADLTHEQAFTRESIGQLTRAAGFREVRCFEDQPVAHGLKSALRLIAWKIARTLLRLYRMAETGEANGIFSQNLLAVARK